MRIRELLGFILVLATATSGLSADKPRPKTPRLDLRASPRMAFSPVNVLLTAELQGGDNSEEFHCPEVEWDWDDGGRSVHQEDCAPLDTGAPLERWFTANHAYRQAGTYNVKITMRRAARPLAVASATVTVRPGLGDMGRID
jgi:PKD repeat protein